MIFTYECVLYTCKFVLYKCTCFVHMKNGKKGQPLKAPVKVEGKRVLYMGFLEEKTLNLYRPMFYFNQSLKCILWLIL